MNLSKLACGLKGQRMFQIMDLAKKMEATGRSIIHLEIGDPDFSSPKEAIIACKNALDSGDTHYASSQGIEELRSLGSELTKKSRGFLPSIEQMVVTAGANVQIFYTVACVADPCDEIIIFEPAFVSYEGIIRLLGCEVISLPLLGKNNFEPDLNQLKDKITNRTKLIILNSPHNPTGSVYSQTIIREIFKIASEKNVYILSDEVYGRMVYPDTKTKFFSAGSIDGCEERVIIAHSLSKSYAMTGWRIGTLVAPKELAKKIALLLETTSSCVAPFIQKGAIAALKYGNDYANDMVLDFMERRDTLFNSIKNSSFLESKKPDSTFYLWSDISKTKMSSENFASLLLDKLGIATCPGNYFGPSGEGYIRFCFAQNKSKIEKAAHLLNDNLDGLIL